MSPTAALLLNPFLTANFRITFVGMCDRYLRGNSNRKLPQSLIRIESRVPKLKIIWGLPNR